MLTGDQLKQQRITRASYTLLKPHNLDVPETFPDLRPSGHAGLGTLQDREMTALA